MNFLNSTQRQRWLFTADMLAEIRSQNRQRSISFIVKAAGGAGGGEAATNGESESSGAGPAPAPLPDLISVEEELLLLKHYQATCQHICQELRFPRKVLGTAVLYLKRFYLTHSTLDYDPQFIVVTCLYLACKIEDCYISAAELARLTGVPQEVLLKNELVLLEGLKFDFIVFSPYRAIEGLVEDITACRRSAADAASASSSSSRNVGRYDTDPSSIDEGLLSLSDEQVAKAKASACAAADALMLTDAPLLYTPGQLALAACRSGFSKVGVRLQTFLDRVVQQAASKGGGEANGSSSSTEEQLQQLRQQLQEVLSAIDAQGIEGAKKPVKEEVAAIDSRLKACRNPLLDPNSEAAKKAAAAKAKARAEKQQRKAEKLRQQKAMLEAGLGLGDIPQQQPAAAAAAAVGQQPGESGEDQPAAKRARPS